MQIFLGTLGTEELLKRLFNNHEVWQKEQRFRDVGPMLEGRASNYSGGKS